MLPTLWQGLTSQLDVDASDPLLEQSLYQELFEICM